MGFSHQVSAGQGGRQPILDSYARLSRNQAGKLEKCETQHVDNRDVIARLGGVLGEEISDPKLSAWNPKVHRPGWERIMKRVAARASDGVVLWNTDRGWRRSHDLEDLFTLLESMAYDSFTVASSHGRYDLSDYNDRYQLRQEVAHNQRNSDEASQRITRRFTVLRKRGIPHHQGRRFGFPGLDRTVSREEALDADGKDTRKLIPADLVERERRALREATDAILAGVFQSTVADEWNAAGLRTTTGKTWLPQMVGEVLLRPINAWLIEHDGEVQGTMAGEPIVKPEQFAKLRALYAGRTQGQCPSGTYVGSGILRCPLRGKGLTGRPHTGNYPDGERRRQYACVKGSGGCGKVSADFRRVDRELGALVVSRLSDAKYAAAIRAARARVSERLAEIHTEINECERLLTSIAAKLGAGKMTEGAYDAANEPLMATRARLEAERDELTGGNPEGPTEAMSREDAAAQWDAGEFDERRAMLTDALGRDTLYLDPAAKTGKRQFDPKRVRIEPYKPATGRKRGQYVA
ncbi:recombinase family protein [Amycolatopsis keratiniphila]|uniref:recombinase family protein n=1 Tax=Amycolatopsis keratiniphila TaxID=129921 RepID=UPI0009F8C976|nr:recombinase family protein [Amycolatopsis keratiniphila]